MRFGSTEVRLIGPPEADGEYVALREDGSDEEVLHLHDYPRLYNVPGLYEHVVQGLLACRSPQVAADGFARALTRLALQPQPLVVLDIGAGTGLVGELLHNHGVSTVLGVDALEEARAACLRDRPGIYTAYFAGDVAGVAADIRRHRPNALVSAGAFGGTHAPASALRDAIALLSPGAPVVFTIDRRWTSTDDGGGFRTAIFELQSTGALLLLERSTFQHRVTPTGQPVHYELFVAATAGGSADDVTSPSMRESAEAATS